MIQFTRDNNAVLYTLNTIYLNLYDEMTSIDFEPLIELKSQMTNKSLTFISGGTTLTYKERYIRMTCFISNDLSSLPVSSIISMGTTEFPYGLYDVTIYQNVDATNLVVANTVKTIWKGLLNLKAVNNNAVTYTENSSTISSPTYITNTL
jgi:hypothetical protein